MPNLQFVDLYQFAARWAGDTTTTGTARAKDAVAEANKQLSYGLTLPALKPWWRKREDTITPVAGTQAYALPTTQGTYESVHEFWYLSSGNRFEIELVDDERWFEEVNEKTSVTGTPETCNLFSDAANTFKIRFNPIPSSGFISTTDGGTIRLDVYIEETLSASSADASEPLMPNSRRMGIAWKAIEMLAVKQGDTPLLAYAQRLGQRYYDMIFDDDVTRLGHRTQQIRPLDPLGKRVSGRGLRTDYGRVRTLR